MRGIELGDVGEEALDEEVIGRGRGFHYRPGHGAPRSRRSRTRRSSRSRRRTSTTSCGSRTATGAKAPPRRSARPFSASAERRTYDVQASHASGKVAACRSCSPWEPPLRRPAGRRGCCVTSKITGSSCRGAAEAGYRLYGLPELNRLRTLRELPRPLLRRARRARLRAPAAPGGRPAFRRRRLARRRRRRPLLGRVGAAKARAPARRLTEKPPVYTPRRPIERI